MIEFVVNFLQKVLSLLAKFVDLFVEGSRVRQGQVLEDGVVTVSKKKKNPYPKIQILQNDKKKSHLETDEFL